MKAICITESGQLELCERPLPVPGPQEVRIKVNAAGINRADLLQRKGLHPPPSGASDIPGLEVSGVVEAVGPYMSEAMIGEQVCALLEGGGYAEYAVARRDLCFPVGNDLDLVQAAGLPEAVFTVAKNVFIIGGLRADEHLLIHGGGSGIGTIALQMGKSVGAFVTVTAGTDEKCQQCVELGADLAINYKEEDLAEVLDGQGLDVVLDVAGGKTLTKDLSLMNTDGRHVSIAYLENQRAEIDIATVMRKRLVITGSTLRHDSFEEKADYAEMIREVFWHEFSDGTLKPVIHSMFRLEDAQKAHDEFAKGLHVGKILLTL